MSVGLALLAVTVAALIGNRILSVLVGLFLRVPADGLLPLVVALDWIQIPFFYWVYENGSTVVSRLPAPARLWLSKDWTASPLGRWTNSLGGAGVLLVAMLPTFGGGMWSAVFLAYGLRLRRSWSYFLMATGSLISYLCLFWVLDTLVRTVRYFAAR
jgi:uncharacterized membrane protein